VNIQNYIASGIVEEYVLGLCSEAEQREVEHLRVSHPVLNDAILTFEQTLEQTAMANAKAAPAGLKAAIFQAIGGATIVNMPTPPQEQPKTMSAIGDGTVVNMPTPPQEQPKTMPAIGDGNVVNMPTPPPPQAIIRSLKIWKYAAAACFALLIGSMYWNFTLRKETYTGDGVVALNSEQYMKLLANPDVKPIAMKGVNTHKICNCTLFWNKTTNEMFVMVHHLPSQGSSSDFQLWAMVDGKPVSVGLLDPANRNNLLALKNIPLDAASFHVTKEAKGGSQAPNMDELYLSGNI
jgi:anti-sigma-K factor RskA